MKRLLIALATVVIVVMPGTPAWAHAQLVSADPAKDAVLTAAPSTVNLEFNERLNPDFTTIVISDAAKQRVPASDVTVDDVHGKLTITGELSNGVYTVAYRVVSVDGHTVQGSYPFTLADPGLPAAVLPAPASPAAAPAPTDRPGGVSTGLLIGVGATALVLAALAVWFFRGARRRQAPVADGLHPEN